jgi:rSAM/selenodomain-associated transferase 2
VTTISVIIPTLGEADAVPRLIHDLLHQGFHEVIIADASLDEFTVKAATHAGAKCLSNLKRGRGHQMNVGARAAKGEVLFFLHADSVVPPTACNAIKLALTQPGVLAGSFRLAFDCDHPLLRFYATCSALNLCITTYGDQGLFVRAAAFHQLSGFVDMALLEDFEIQRRLRRLGRFVKLPGPIVTSARRFVRRGILVQQLLNIAIVLAFLCRVSPDRLSKWYDGVPKSKPSP